MDLEANPAHIQLLVILNELSVGVNRRKAIRTLYTTWSSPPNYDGWFRPDHHQRISDSTSSNNGCEQKPHDENEPALRLIGQVFGSCLSFHLFKHALPLRIYEDERISSLTSFPPE